MMLLIRVLFALSSGIVVWIVKGLVEGGSSLDRVVDGSSFEAVVGDASFGGVVEVVEAVGVPGFLSVQVSLGVSSGVLVCTVNDAGGSSFGGAVVAVEGVSGVLLVSCRTMFRKLSFCLGNIPSKDMLLYEKEA